jgi:predicted protein tyrosine phosphatase
MKIVVSPLSSIHHVAATHRPELVVSILDPDFAFPELGSSYRGRHLRLHFHDAHEPLNEQVVPSAEHIDQLLAFVSRWTRSSPLAIHCRAGIGRSSAAGFIAACLLSPTRSELDIARELRSVSSMARPNELLIQLADTAMNRRGRMIDAIRSTGRDLTWDSVLDENHPFELTIR